MTVKTRSQTKKEEEKKKIVLPIKKPVENVKCIRESDSDDEECIPKYRYVKNSYYFSDMGGHYERVHSSKRDEKNGYGYALSSYMN
jgi:hypothetical protein